MVPPGRPLGHSWMWETKALFSAFTMVSIFLRNERGVTKALISAHCMSEEEAHGPNSAPLKQNKHKGEDLG